MLKPIDLTVLAYLRTELRESSYTQVEVAAGLGISQSSVHRALQQLEHSLLLSSDDRPFRDVLVYAVQRVYPASIGAPSRGVATAWAHPSITEHIHAADTLVWPTDEGDALGPSLEPLHPCVPAAARNFERFYEAMALIDVLRVGRVRERALAIRRLDEILEVS